MQGIDYSDIPPLTPEQLAQMVRLRDVRRKVPVSVRLDPKVTSGCGTVSNGVGRGTREPDQRYSCEPDGGGTPRGVGEIVELLTVG